MKSKAKAIIRVVLLWCCGWGLAAAQGNSIDSFDVSQSGGRTMVRITTKEPL
jgi:hypothetical protein